MSKNNYFDQLVDKLKKVVSDRTEDKIKQLEKQIEDLRNNKEKNFLESELPFGHEVINGIIDCVDDASTDKSYSEEARKYFRKIRNDFIDIGSMSRGESSCFGGPSRETIDFDTSLGSAMSHIAKEKPAEINNFIALIILKTFAVNFVPGIYWANNFYQQFAVHLKGE